MHQILAIPIPIPIMGPRTDALVWGENNTRQLTVKSTYQFLYRENFGCSDLRYWWKALWRINFPSHIKHFLWKVAHRKILVRAQLIHRGLNITSSFPLCVNHVESIDHLLINCPITQKVWDWCKLNLGIDIIDKCIFYISLVSIPC